MATAPPRKNESGKKEESDGHLKKIVMSPAAFLVEDPKEIIRRAAFYTTPMR
jgi:hypothetical protein